MISLLIVDDEQEILEEIFDIVFEQYCDFRILKTSIPREAKGILETDNIDILLTDIRMPGLDGFELSALARTNNNKCKIIFLTGYDDFKYAYTAIKSGCDDFILKTSTKKEIINSLAKVIQSISHEREERELLLEYERIKQLSKPQQKNEQSSTEFVKNYIWNNIDKDIFLNELASKVYLSPAYLSRLFKSTTGITITEYLVHARIEKAKQLLVSTQIKVQEISKKVGIDSPVYFARVFKKEVGMTPQEYRHQNI